MKAETGTVPGVGTLPPRLHSEHCKTLEKDRLWDVSACGSSWEDPECSPAT